MAIASPSGRRAAAASIAAACIAALAGCAQFSFFVANAPSARPIYPTVTMRDSGSTSTRLDGPIIAPW